MEEPSWEGYGYFLESHILHSALCIWCSLFLVFVVKENMVFKSCYAHNHAFLKVFNYVMIMCYGIHVSVTQSGDHHFGKAQNSRLGPRVLKLERFDARIKS